jgi:hypothetical protein
MTTPVKFELAKLLKEKGFDKYCTSGYTESGDVYLHQGGQEPVKNGHGYYEGRNYNGGEFYCSAPTIAEVVMWLYEKHGIWISVSITIQKEYYYQCIDITGKKDSTKNNYPSRICKPGNYYNSPTEAYEAAIEYTLNNLI